MSKSTQREDHLKALYALGQSPDADSGWVSTNRMAAHLGVKPPSVTAMTQVLSELGWVDHRPYRGARLTEAGQKLALSLVRKHRLWETFLVEHLEFSWDEVHDIAEQLEHVDSVELVERLDQFLGRPTTDPHGDPIPRADGSFHPKRQALLLSELNPSQRCTVTGVRDGHDGLFSALTNRNIGLGSVLTPKVIASLTSEWLSQMWVVPEQEKLENG